VVAKALRLSKDFPAAWGNAMRIVEDIYDALTDDEAFAALPAALARAADARSCILQAFTPNNDLLLAVYNDYYPLEAYAFYVEAEMFRHDPWRSPFEQPSRLNTACSSRDLVDPEDYKRSVFYNDFYRQFGDDTAHCLGGVMTHRDGVVTLGIHRGMAAESFSEAETAAMQVAIPHLRRLLTVKAQVQAAGAQGLTARGLLDALPQGVLVVDHLGLLIYANAKGEALLRPGRPLTLRAGHIRAREHRDDLRLVELILSAGLGVGGRGGAMSTAAADGPGWRITVTPWRTGERTRVIVLLDEPEAADPSLAAKLSGLYGLTAAEAEIAAALAEGLSPAEIAERREVSLATVRSQIHQALRKSDARSLADLVRLAASLPRLGLQGPE
jgi:DNA-binding CsgD family transcriptional regulator